MIQEYEANIGIEVHVQLNTDSKLFCASDNAVTERPNSHICPVCSGYPGVLPVFNKKVLDFAIMAGIATNSTIHEHSEFARKHYFYPDLPAGYQISQHDKPICTEGFVTIHQKDASEKKIRLIRIHIEEDAGKNLHAPNTNESFVDLNRAGTPLLEIVSYPDISSSEEVRRYLKTLRNIVMYLGITTGNMEEGAFRADTNVSVRKRGTTKLGTRCELKNINSFKFIADAVEYEIARQVDLLDQGKLVRQETRSWDTKEHKTVPLRTKEEAADYRYFADPNLPIIKVAPKHIEEIRATLPELPDAKARRLASTYNLSPYEIEILINDAALCDYFEDATTHTSSKALINWVLRDLLKLIKDQKITPAAAKITPQYLGELLELIEKGTINSRTAQELFGQSATTGKSPQQLVREQGLEQVSSPEELGSIIKEIIAANPQQTEQYKAGKEKLFGFFVGAVMKKTQGKGNPQLINELLKKHLS